MYYVTQGYILYSRKHPLHKYIRDRYNAAHIHKI